MCGRLSRSPASFWTHDILASCFVMKTAVMQLWVLSAYTYVRVNCQCKVCSVYTAKHLQKCSDMTRVIQWIAPFCLPPNTSLIRKASPPISSYLLRPYPRKFGQAELTCVAGDTKINFPHQKLRPETVTHPSTNQAQRRSTLPITVHYINYYFMWPKLKTAKPRWTVL